MDGSRHLAEAPQPDLWSAAPTRPVKAPRPHFHGHRERLRDRFRDAGADALTDSPSASDVQAQYDFEPEAGTLLSALLPKYISTRIYSSLLDAAASESAARRTAMHSQGCPGRRRGLSIGLRVG